MSKQDWFRNKTWNDEIEVAFMAKLKRARRKSQYLRIQASCLSATYPEVALKLLDLYFAQGDVFDHTTAYTQRAKIYISQGKIDKAIEAYLNAVDAEQMRPNVKSGVSVDFPLFVANHRLLRFYEKATELLAGVSRAEMIFPVNVFKANAALAMIEAERGDKDSAKHFATQALVAARMQHSGFRCHPDLGLVSDKYKTELLKLKCIEASGTLGNFLTRWLNS